MNLLETQAALAARAMELLEAASGLSVSELCQLGFDHPAAKRYVELADTYFGPTKSTRKQSDARAAAIKNKHTFNTLELIEKHVRRLDDATKAWALRRTLCRREADYHALNRFAREEVERLNGPGETAPARTAVSYSNPAGTLDRTMHLTGPEARVANLFDRARALAEELDIDLAEAMFTLFEEGTGGAATYTPKVIVRLEDYVAILNGDGDDVELAVTNGARMTGAEYMQSRFTDYFECVLIDPVRGPISMGTGVRFATPKQRGMIEPIHPVCAEPGCCQPADLSQINHNIPHSRDGPTDLSNLTLLCRYHNGVAGDKVRYQNVNGEGHRIRPDGTLERNEHPTAKLGAMRII
ncbi:HNH endonuclease signature motif containing protein [Corynebacterium sp. S7]